MNELPIDGKQEEPRDVQEVEEQSAHPESERDDIPAGEVGADEPAASIETESEPEETIVSPKKDEAPSSLHPQEEQPELPSATSADSEADVIPAPDVAAPETVPTGATASGSSVVEDTAHAERQPVAEEQSKSAPAYDAPEAADGEPITQAEPAASVENELPSDEESTDETDASESQTGAPAYGEPHAREGEHYGEGELYRPRIILKAGTDPESIKALELCREKVAQLHLKMHPLAARWDGEKHVTIFFRADDKVDFRKLVRELSRVLRARIELRQLGPREQGKLCGLVGKCGLPLCCQTFLSEFAQSSIKMAKTQDLALNPMKISGVCGRLLCCLNYEQEMYAEVKSRMPKVNKWVDTEFGPGRVSAVNVLKETVTVHLETATRELPLDQVRISEAPPQS